MESIRYGIIGVGHLGEIHTRLAAGIHSINLAGVYDTDEKRSASIADKYGTKAYRNLEELLQEVDAVSIVVPTEHHLSNTRKAIENDCHVFIEKPIAENSSQGEEIVSLARDMGKKIQVGHIERFNPAFLALQGQDIAPLFIESHRLSQFNPRGTDVSVILDLMIHDIDIVLSLIDSPVKTIDACGVNVVSESEDIANVRIRFENDSVVNMTSSRISAKDMRKMRLFQKNAYVSLDFLDRNTEIFKLKQEDNNGDEEAEGHIQSLGCIGVGDKTKEVLLESPECQEINSLELEIREFAEAILEYRPTAVSGSQGLRALQVAEIILGQIRHPNLQLT